MIESGNRSNIVAVVKNGEAVDHALNCSVILYGIIGARGPCTCGAESEALTRRTQIKERT